jgi:CHAP domain
MFHRSLSRAFRWPVILLLAAVLLLACVAPSSVLMSSLLLFSPASVAECGLAGPTPATTTSDCGIDPEGNAIVAWALAIATHLSSCPDIYDPGQLPPYMDTCYTPTMPQAVIQYWQETCPGCREWQNGNLQCVMLVLAAFGLAGARAPIAGNAISFWWNYARLPGWIEIPEFFMPGSTSALAPPSARGPPRPGDMVVWFISWDPLVGHIAVVVKVTLPSAGHLGSLTFAEANGPTPLYTMSINPDLSVNSWSGYFVAGYVRDIGSAPA